MAVPQTTLAEVLDASETGVDVHDALGFASSDETDDLVLVESELMLVTAGLGSTTWTVARGYGDSDAAAHADGSTVSRVERGSTNLTRVKTRLDVDDDDDDAVLPAFVAAVNAEIARLTGIFIGPSTALTRTLDGSDARDDGRRLWIPGGMRSIGTLEVKPPGGSFETVTAADYRLGPKSWELRPGQPYAYVEFVDYITGNWSRFPRGKDNVRASDTVPPFGYASVPDDLAELGDMLVVRMWNARQSGQSMIVKTEVDGSTQVSRFLWKPEREMLDAYRRENDPYRSV